MLLKKIQAIVLAVCMAVLLTGGFSQVFGDALLKKMEFMEVSPPEMMEVSEFEFLEVTEPEFLQVSAFEFMPVSEPEFLTPTTRDGVIVWEGDRTNYAYLRCAVLRDFEDLRNCTLEAIGITQEELDRAIEKRSAAQ